MSRYQDISENDQEMIDAMKVSPAADEKVVVEDEGDEGQEFVTEEDGPQRGPDGKFVSKKAAKEPEEDAGEEAGEEAEPDEEPAEGEQKLKPGTVPIQALDSERNKRREMDIENAALREQMSQLQAQLQALTAAQQPAQPAQPAAGELGAAPDPVLDPKAFSDWLAKREEALKQPYQEFQKAQQAQQQRQQALSTLTDYTTRHETAFRQTHPDKNYDAALQYAAEQVAEDFRMAGYPEAEIPAMVNRRRVEVAAQAYDRGIDPAGFIYNYAVRMGYKPPEQGQDDGDKIERLATVQQRTRSTAPAGGAARADEITAEALAKMSEAEFGRMWQKNPEAVKRALGG